MKTSKVASFMFITCFLALFMVSINAERVFKVGNELGWREPAEKDLNFYTQWAERNRFCVGDSLLFEYRNDSVVEVEKWGYHHCNTTGSIVYFNNGKSTIKLEKSGMFFFISGTPNHCRKGQRLIVDVMGLHHRGSNSPPSIANPPQSELAPSPQSTLSKSSGWAAVSVGLVSIFTVVLSIIVAFVGSS